MGFGSPLFLCRQLHCGLSNRLTMTSKQKAPAYRRGSVFVKAIPYDVSIESLTLFTMVIVFAASLTV